MSFLSVRRALLCSENDDSQQNSQKYWRSRIRLPSRLVLFVVLQDQDHPLLQGVDCSALLHVRDLAEDRQIFTLSLSFPPNFSEPCAHGLTI